ncbi:MAG: dephospho-CoA kinase [Ruminococcaceae bacterium]|nr:dephospho-CoA kinase [Oscillospiraceae bacterium]
MSIIGLTGPSGAGKSMAAKEAVKLGFKVIDCDMVARQAVLPQSEGLKALVEAFGKEILCEDGDLNRKVLAKIAFSSLKNTEKLNKTLLPHIVALIKPQLNDGNVLLDAPTLFESGLDSVCDTTVAVLADRHIRLNRIIVRDSLTINEAETRLNAGKSDDFYLQNAKHILYNNNDSAAFSSAASKLWRSLL